ncbi:alpha/beta hydrolase [Facklamia sp. 7083-14-GEN3]|uniref:alpha/beta hydrolase n=1 Tax=Facklamia sp. 7083-14-GEN3 TaxID=2973478 RepID=UPI00215D2F9E|nr:alpha/beta hydrolase [Facklamia sp. 7083-14-GEN3]MCR8969371.1 alpha/beta hydrolase [Facklamia sp. 7083-14-GEN3]
MYKSSATQSQMLIYLHGGGLIFGQREDLPSEYIELLNNKGYSILALDYLLAPESNLEQIINLLIKTLEWYQNEGYQLAEQSDPAYYLFGRSAGGYLALQLATKMSSEWLKAIINFYGYYKLNDANFIYPNPYHNKAAKVSKELVETFVQSNPISNGKQNERYLIYLYCRQVGNWIDFLTDDPSKFSLTQEQIVQLPPLLLVHADKDPDVPIQQSKQLNKFANQSQLIEVASADHDFDRTNLIKGREVYQQVIEWLDSLSN